MSQSRVRAHHTPEFREIWNSVREALRAGELDPEALARLVEEQFSSSSAEPITNCESERRSPVF